MSEDKKTTAPKKAETDEKGVDKASEAPAAKPAPQVIQAASAEPAEEKAPEKAAEKPAEEPKAAEVAPEPPKVEEPKAEEPKAEEPKAAEATPEPPKSPFAYERNEELKKGRVINKSDTCVCVFEWMEGGKWFSESKTIPDIGNAIAWVDEKF